MWNFNQDDYVKQVLLPAVTEFTKNGALPDAFERYSLDLNDFDPNDIPQATKTISSYWNKTTNNPKYEKLLKVLISEHKEKTQELTDEKAREALYKWTKDERNKRQEKRFLELDSRIKIVAGKGFLNYEERDSLIKEFTAKGLTEQEILSRIGNPVREEKKRNPPEQGLDSTTRTKIRSNLATLGKSNLYEFLDIRRGATNTELEQKYKELTADWNKRKNDNKKTSAQTLLSIVKDKLLKDGLDKYEKALVWNVIEDELRALVEFAAMDRIISRQEFEELINQSIKCGLSRKQAVEAILWLADEKKAYVEEDENEKRIETIICAECRTSVAKENNKCTSCGKNLWVVCPKCATKIAASESACGNCGFVTVNRHRVDLLIRKVHFALDEKQLDDALKFAREAENLWGRTDDVEIILNKVEQLLEQAKSYRKDYDEAISQKKLLTARDRLVMLIGISPLYRGWDEKTPQILQLDLELQLQKANALLEKARKAESEKKFDELIRIYQEIQNIAVDFDEVTKGFKRFAPESPSNISTRVYDNGIIIKWDESSATGHVEYVIVRCENRPPATSSDGEVVAKVPNNSFTDESVRPGSFVYYGVFAERGGAFSKGIVSEGVLAIKEVNDLSLEAGEKVIHGSWKFSVSEGKIRVFCGSESELRKGLGREIKLTNPNSFTDDNLINDKTYSYRVFVEYTDPSGKIISTNGKFASATPVILPKAVERLDIRSNNGELHFQWTPPPFGKVNIYRLAQKPTWKYGTLISINSLGQIGTLLNTKSECLAIDPNISKSRVYYTPFTVVGESVVVGQTKSFIPAEEISELVVEDFEAYILLRWKWSGSFQSVIVSWRHDEYPIDADDKKAVKHKVTRGEYDINGGFRIPNPHQKPYKFTVFTISENESRTVYSVGLNPDCRGEARTDSVAKIKYSLRLKGWLKWKSFVLSLESEETIPSLPELLMVAKQGDILPLDSKSGKIVARIENVSLTPSHPFEFEFEMPKVKRPFSVRLFFAAPNSYKKYKLLDPPPKQLKVK